MKKRVKPAAAVCILVCMAISSLSGGEALAASGPGYSASAGGVSAPVLSQTADSGASADFSVTDYQGLVKTAVGQYVRRNPLFTVRYNADSAGSLDNAAETILNDIFTYDDPTTTSDLDYLLMNMIEWNLSVTIYSSSAENYGIFEFSQSYRTTADQEDAVNGAVAAILKKLNVGSADACTKIKAVHDYVLNNVTYDGTKSKYSAYDALSSGQAVCQGYVLLTYKLLAELQVPVRIICGTTTEVSGGHAWNIVKLGRYWYNLDVTWDDTGGIASAYYLKGASGFSDHIPGDAYSTAEFHAAYPISPDDYKLDVLGAVEDDGPSSWAKGGVNALKARGVIPASLLSGWRNTITRAEFTALVVNVYEYAKGPCVPESAPPFTDIGGSPYAGQISKGFEVGIVAGASTFNPDGSLNREQCAKLVSAAVGIINGTPVSSGVALPFVDVGKIDGWALTYVQFAFENGLMAGSGGNFDPFGLLTREQAMLIAERMIEKYKW